jgi:hypothetical protein
MKTSRHFCLKTPWHCPALLVLLTLMLVPLSQTMAQSFSPAFLPLPAGPVFQATDINGNTLPNVGTPNVAIQFFVPPGFQDELWKMTFSGLPAGLAIGNTTYEGWCADPNGPYTNNAVAGQSYQLISTYSSAIPANAQSAHWGAVNFVINSKSQSSRSAFDRQVMQEVIWKLLTGSYDFDAIPPSNTAVYSAADALYSQALNNLNFVPTGAGSVTAVLMYKDGMFDSTGGYINDPARNHFQELIIEVPVPCTIPAVIISNTSWNKFNIPAGSSPFVWVHAHIGKPSGVPTNQKSAVLFTGATIALDGTVYPLPDGLVVFDPSAPSVPTTTFNGNNWVTTFNPNNLSDEMFFLGAAIPVTPAIANGAKATLSFRVLSENPALSFSWQWSAAVYTFWPTDWNQANVLPYHQSLHAGTPQNVAVQQSLIQGPRGGGGSNFTGSWSATGNGVCPTK